MARPSLSILLLVALLLWSSDALGARKEKLQVVQSADDGTDPGAPPGDLDHTGYGDDEGDDHFGFEDEGVPAADVIQDPPLHWVGSHKSGEYIALNATKSMWTSPFTIVLKVLPHHTSSHGPTAAAMESHVRAALSEMRGEQASPEGGSNKVGKKHANEVKKKDCLKSCLVGSHHHPKGDTLKCANKCMEGIVPNEKRMASGEDVAALVQCVEESHFVSMAWWCVRKFHGYNDTKPVVSGPRDARSGSDVLKDEGSDDEPPLPEEDSAVHVDNSSFIANDTMGARSKPEWKPLVHEPVVMKQHKPLGKAIDKKHLACLKSSLFGANDDHATRTEAIQAVMSVCMKKPASPAELKCLNTCIDGMKEDDEMEGIKNAALCAWSCFSADSGAMADLSEAPLQSYTHPSAGPAVMQRCVTACLTAHKDLRVQKVITCAHKCQTHQNSIESKNRNVVRAILTRRVSYEIRHQTSLCLKRARGDDKDVAFTAGDVKIARTCVLRSVRSQYDSHPIGMFLVKNSDLSAIAHVENGLSESLEKCVEKCFHKIALKFSTALGADSVIPRCARDCGSEYYRNVHKVEVRLEQGELQSGLLQGDKCSDVCLRNVVDLSRLFDVPTAAKCIVGCYRRGHVKTQSLFTKATKGSTLEMEEAGDHHSRKAMKSCGKHCVGRCTGTEGLTLPKHPRAEDVQCLFSCLNEKKCIGPALQAEPSGAGESNSTMIVETVLRQGCSFFIGTVNGVWKYGVPPVLACSTSNGEGNIHNLFPKVMTAGLMVRKKPMMIALSVKDDGRTVVFLNGQRANKFQWSPPTVTMDPEASMHAPRIADVNDLSVSGVIGDDDEPDSTSDSTPGSPENSKSIHKGPEIANKNSTLESSEAKPTAGGSNIRGTVQLDERAPSVVKPDLIAGMGNIAEALVMAGRMSFDERIYAKKAADSKHGAQHKSEHDQEMVHASCVTACLRSTGSPLEKKTCVEKCLSGPADSSHPLRNVSKERVEECSVCIANCMVVQVGGNVTETNVGQCVSSCVHPGHRCGEDISIALANGTHFYTGMNMTSSNSSLSSNSTSHISASTDGEGQSDAMGREAKYGSEPEDLYGVFENGPGSGMDGWNAVVIGNNYDGMVCGVSIWDRLVPDLDIYQYSKQRNDEYMKQEHGDTCGVIHLPASPPPEATSHEHPEDWQPRPVEAFFGDTSHHLGGKPAWNWNLNVQSDRVVETGDEVPTNFWPEGFSVVATVWTHYAAAPQVLVLVGPSECGGMQLMVRNGHWAFGQRCGDMVEFKHAKFRSGRLYGVAVVYDKRSRQATLYLNGVEEEVKEMDVKEFTNDSGEIVVGSDDSAGTIHVWRGDVCDVSVYKGLAHIGTLSSIKDYGCKKNKHSPVWSFLEVLSKRVKRLPSKPLPGDMYPEKGFTISARVKYVQRNGLGKGQMDSQVVLYRGTDINDCSGFMLSVEDGEWYFGNPCEKHRRSGLRALSGRHYSVVISYGPKSVGWYINGQRRPGHVAYSTMASTGYMFVGAKDQKMVSGQWLGAICGVEVFRGLVPKQKVSAMYQWSLDHLQDLCTPDDQHLARTGPAWSWEGATGVQLGSDIQTGTLEPDVPKDMWGGEFTVTVKIRTAHTDDGSWQDVISRGSNCGGVLLALFEKHLYFGRNCKPHPDTGVVLQDDTTYLIAVAYSQKLGLAKVFVDGSLAGTVNVPLHLDSDDDLYIGGADAAGNEHVMQGRVCAVDIYEGALSEGRIEKSISARQEAAGGDADPCDR